MQKIALALTKKLQKAGFISFWAGGAPRDLLLKKIPQDIDIVTSARPKEVEKVFKKEKKILVGKAFGVIKVIKDGFTFDVATFRRERKYKSGRWPKEVSFTDAKEDARRRDFTINGIFYDPVARKFYDFVGGKKDLKKKILRFIGDAEERMREDHLRMLRAVRFKNAFGLKYAPGTKKAIKKNAPLLKKISWERIRDELNKMFIHPSRLQALLDLDELGVLKVVLPELSEMKGVEQPFEYHGEGDVWQHTLLVLKALPKKVLLPLVWAALLHDVGKKESFRKEGFDIGFIGHVSISGDIARKILKRLRFSEKEINQIEWLVEHHLLSKDVLMMRKSRMRHWFLNPHFPLLLDLFKYDALGCRPGGHKPDLTLYRKIKKLYEQTLSELPPKLPKLIDGHDVMKIKKIKAGPEVGKWLKRIYDLQLEGKIKTRKEALNFLKQ